MTSRIRAKAQGLADKQTKKQVNDPDVWQHFKDSRARQLAEDRKFSKMAGPFAEWAPRSDRRKSSIESAHPPV
jgi:hypothetical protein